jgi:branched-chain amino acid transport system ATP-binding protein
VTSQPAATVGTERPVPATLLRVVDLQVRIAGSHILQGVDFDVPDRGVTAVLGRNGVGKTTTLKAILGLVPRTGHVSLAGEPLDGLRPDRIVRRGIGYVPEDRDVFAGLSVAENLRLAERSGKPRYPVVHELFPELRSRARQAAGTLSGGQQQMLSLARALLNQNRLLLIDEPTKGLAPKLVGEVVDALTRVAATTPVLLVEQNMPAVRRLADHVVVMTEGRIAHRGPASSLDDAALTRRLLGVSTAKNASAGVAGTGRR